MSSGPVTIRARAWLIVWVRPARALRLATISARIASTCPSRPFAPPRARPDRAARPALPASGGSDGIQRIGLALPAPVLPVGAVDLHHPDPGRGEVAGQAGAVAAGPLDPYQAHRPEPTQPGQQLGVPGRGGRELFHAEQPADRARARRRRARRRGCPAPPVMARACTRVSTMVTVIPFSLQG